MLLIEIAYSISFHRCLADENLVLFFDKTFSYLFPDDVLSKIADLGHIFKILRKKGEIESNFLNTPTGGLKLNHYLVQYSVYPIIQFELVIKYG